MVAVRNKRIVDVIDELTQELRVANQIAALRLGSSALDDVDEKSVKTPVSVKRIRRMNRLRAGIRAGLGVEDVAS